LNQVFHILDTNGDGVLSFEEISKGYQTVYGPSVGQAVAEETFAKLDLNNNGIL
jgi:Ca2+-binding EF-hand superfamily protein